MSLALPVDLYPSSPAEKSGDDVATVAAVPEQIRAAIHVGNYNVDTSLSAHAPLSIVMEGLVPLLTETLRSEGLPVDFTTTGVYTLAVEGGMPLARTVTLSEAGVLDGARLLLREVHSTEVFKPIIEDGSDALAEFNAVKFSAFTAATARALALTAIVAGAVATAILTISAWWSTPLIWWWMPPSAAMTVLAVTGAVVAQRRSAQAVSYVLGIAAVPLAFTAGWVSVPAYEAVAGHWTTANLFAAIFAAGTVSCIGLWLTGIGITVHTAAMCLAATGTAAAAARTFINADLRQIGTVAVVAGMIVAAIAPGLSLWLAGVKPPSLPVPGEDLDRNELDEAAMVIEVFDDGNDVRTVALSDDEDTQLERRSRVSNKYLTGLFIAAVIIVAAGAIMAIEPGAHYFWGETAVAVLSVLILILRGRSLPDRVQALTFFAGAVILTTGLSLTAVIGTSNPLAALAVIGAVVLTAIVAALAGLFLPRKKLSPITLLRIEQLEFFANLAVAVLTFWVIGAWSFFRNLL